MKYIILLLIVPSISFAECQSQSQESTEAVTTQAPKPLQGGEITVVTREGYLFTFKSDEYMVVPRKHTRKVVNKQAMCTAESKRNRVSVLAGQGAQSGLTTKRNGPNAEVESNVGFVGGAQYQRLLNDRISVGVQVQSSETALGVIGLEF